MANKITMNQGKTKTIAFSFKTLKLLISFRGIALKTETDVTYLGVQFDFNLIFTAHIQNVKNR